MTNSQTETESRQARRIRTLKSGCVYFLNGHVATDCIIRNLTREGARLEFEHPFEGPTLLMLQVGIGDLVNAKIDCQVRWRRGNHIGVFFNKPQDVVPTI